MLKTLGDFVFLEKREKYFSIPTRFFLSQPTRSSAPKRTVTSATIRIRRTAPTTSCARANASTTCPARPTWSSTRTRTFVTGRRTSRAARATRRPLRLLKGAGTSLNFFTEKEKHTNTHFRWLDLEMCLRKNRVVTFLEYFFPVEEDEKTAKLRSAKITKYSTRSTYCCKYLLQVALY